MGESKFQPAVRAVAIGAVVSLRPSGGRRPAPPVWVLDAAGRKLGYLKWGGPAEAMAMTGELRRAVVCDKVGGSGDAPFVGLVIAIGEDAGDDGRGGN